MLIEIILGFLLAIGLLLLSQRIFPNKIQGIWGDGLIIAAAVYVVFALIGKNWDWLPIEIGGVFIYGFFIFLSRKYSILFTAVGWGLHVLWDILLHANGQTDFVPTWYPGMCLGFDIAVAGFFIWYFLNKTQSTQSL